MESSPTDPQGGDLTSSGPTDNAGGSPLPAEGDPPIIVSGGSVMLDVPAGFTEGKPKKFKHPGKLDHIIIDGKSQPLNRNSRIEIHYK